MEKDLTPDYSQPMVKLKAFTQTVDDFDVEAEDLVAYVARVSNPSNQMNFETSDRLLGYLIRNSHWSPLEMVDLMMEIETTRDIARQILRHRSFVFQEFSQRYADPTCPTAGLGFVLREARLQDIKNRQNSIEGVDEEIQSLWEAAQLRVLEATQDAYAWAIENGIAKEQARVVLPEGLTKSRLYMKGSLRSWIHYIALREHVATQKEHREIALCAKAELFRVYPFVEKAWPEIIEQIHSSGLIKQLRADLEEAESQVEYLQDQLFDERMARETD